MLLVTTPTAIKHGVDPPRSSWIHTSCTAIWKDLHGKDLQEALENIMNEYTTDIVLNKLAPCLNSQRNESLNGTIGSKNPKIRYYGGSKSSDFRIACGVAQ